MVVEDWEVFFCVVDDDDDVIGWGDWFYYFVYGVGIWYCCGVRGVVVVDEVGGLLVGVDCFWVEEV